MHFVVREYVGRLKNIQCTRVGRTELIERLTCIRLICFENLRSIYFVDCG
nr:MAG TPA: hypothetical protein [Caudoviricetes sp.]